MAYPPQQKSLIEEARSFNAKKRLGQHFLVNPDVLGDIEAALELEKTDTVVEIGPGLGFLTRYLVKSGAQVIAIELDPDCVTLLSKLRAPNLKVIHADFLTIDLSLFGASSLKIVGNIPYQITSPILARVFGEIDAPNPSLRLVKEIVLTVQHEVALRFIAGPGTKDYSQITLLTNCFANARILQTVDAQSFFPVPQVNSAVVKFVPLSEPRVACKDRRLLRQLIQAGFRQRRKMFKNNLSFLKLDDNELMAIFAQLRIDPQARAERLSLQQFANLADIITHSKEAHNSRQ